MIYKDNNWSIGENFVVISDNFDHNLDEVQFEKLISSLKDLKDHNQSITNAISLLKDYRESFDYISRKVKVGALTDIENIVNRKLGK